MEFERIKKYLQKEEEEEEDDEHTKLDQLPFRFFDPFIISTIQVDLIEPDRVFCSFKIPPRLVVRFLSLFLCLDSSFNFSHTHVGILSIQRTKNALRVKIDPSRKSPRTVYTEEIEIEAKKVRVGKAIAVVSVEFRKKATGKIIAQGRHTKYLPVKSNL
ncbi:hypothetical protein Cgig2_024900 [Carnegiea gigantea]|uniref:Thioesterase domain-containing protein n=1 Tax=Carnegiea gigantea TaxID=171969 RepID=A0A9Q1KE33_9CARY|nr:hypothetical protein Cgig2_024900 [Carnegiea gigantea]